MISSTRSSESASRSSWKDASSVISFSSTPSCSASISLTRSKTSSRDANRLSLLFSLSGRGARRCYTVGEAVGEPAHDAVIDPAGGEADRVRDRLRGRVAVGDHGQPAQAEKVGAAVRLGIEPLAHPSRRAPNQKAAELPSRRRLDLLAERVENLRNRALEKLERDVAGEPVADDDICRKPQQLACLGVAAEVETGLLRKELMRLE